ncbi:AAA family ATPase [Pseudoclavibacter helvolus]|uniref:AAA family ATPase n=1 Tax=Pseudoclavibacter helvolus TaxID=255205 RepID=UPI0024AE4348|nr:DUF3696 domain-containing protein [Pseudoclavibacter helvolus]
MDLGPSTTSISRGSETARAMSVTLASQDGHTTYLSRQHLEGQDGQIIVQRSRNAPGAAFSVKSTLLPSNLTAGRPMREVTALRTELRQEKPNGFLFSGIGALLLPRRVREDQERWNRVQEWYNAAYRLYEVQTNANHAIEKFLREILYLGPLRSLAQRTYRLAPESPTEIGEIGEFAPEMLFRLRDSGELDGVNHWLGNLGYGELKFEKLNDEYFQVLLESKDGGSVNIADTGVGLSQVIPLLVQATLAKPGSTMIAQQPEIHLNPAQQSVVTDFLIERANEGVRTIVESHSEHILLRLRRRIAEGTIKASDVAIYFVEGERGTTNLRPITIGPRGELSRDDWPRGFFEDQLTDSFAMAAAQSTRPNA